jgi:hypothetical protein
VLQTTFPNASTPFRFPRTVAKAADFSVTVNDGNSIFLVDTSGGDVTISPAAVATLGGRFRVFVIKVTDDDNVVVFDPNGAETVNGAATYTIADANIQTDFVCSGSEWFAVGGSAGGGGAWNKFAGVSAKTADYAVSADDVGVMLVANKATTVTFTLPSADDLADGLLFVRNIGAGPLVVTRNAAPGTDTIEGSASISLAQHEGAALYVDDVGSFRTIWMPSAELLTTRGDILVRGANGLERLACGAAGQFLGSDGTDVGYGYVPGVTAIRVQVFTSSGTYIPDPNLVAALCVLVGGGASGTNSNGGAPGGGGAETAISVLTPAQIGASKALTVGAAGVYGSGTSSGNDGGDSSLGTLMVAKGGDHGSTGHPGTPGSGGTGGTGTILIPGGTGGSPSNQSTSAPDGGPHGSGGDSFLGSGGGAGAYDTGRNGDGYGAGGSGGNSSSGHAGSGTSGIFIAIEFCSQ